VPGGTATVVPAGTTAGRGAAPARKEAALAARTARGLAAALVVAGLMGCTSGPHQWSPASERNFFWACRDASVRTGLDTTGAEAYCKCAMRGAQVRMSESALAGLEADLAKGGSMPDNVIQIITACRASSSAY
jgi:hypothetical protein